MGAEQSSPSYSSALDEQIRFSAVGTGRRLPLLIVGSHRQSKQSHLFQSITVQDWNGVLNRLRKHPREAAGNNAFRLELYGLQRKDVTPLHLICSLKPPVEVIQLILDLDGSESAGTFMKNVNRRRGIRQNVVSLFSAGPDGKKIDEWSGNNGDRMAGGNKPDERVIQASAEPSQTSVSNCASASVPCMEKSEECYDDDGDEDDTELDKAMSMQLLSSQVESAFRCIVQEGEEGDRDPGLRPPDSAYRWDNFTVYDTKERRTSTHQTWYVRPPSMNQTNNRAESSVSTMNSSSVAVSTKSSFLMQSSRSFTGMSTSKNHIINQSVAKQLRDPSLNQFSQRSRSESTFSSLSSHPQIALQLKPTGSVIGLSPKDIRYYVHSENNCVTSDVSNTTTPENQRLMKISTKSFHGTKNAVADPEANHWLPIHVACLFQASPGAIFALLQVYPWGAKVKNGMGMLPIHIVCANIQEPPPVFRSSNPFQNVHNFLWNREKWDVVKTVHLLLRAFPESIHVPSSNADGMTPLQYARDNLMEGSKKKSIIKMLQGDLASLTPLPSSIPANETQFGDETRKSKKDSGPNIHSFRTCNTDCSNNRRFYLVDRSPKLKTNKKTRLLTHISAQEWKLTLNRIAKVPSEASVWTMIDTGSRGGGFSQIEVVDGDACHRLPIHRACALKPPLAVVEALHLAYPKGLSCKEKYGMLPIHLACEHGASYEVVEYIIQAYPNGVHMKDTFGLLPIHIACTEGAPLAVMNLLLSWFPESATVKDSKGWSPLDYAKVSFHPHKDAIITSLEAWTLTHVRK